MGYSEFLEYKNVQAWTLFLKKVKPLIIKVTFASWRWHVFLWVFTILLCYLYNRIEPSSKEYHVTLIPRGSDRIDIREASAWSEWFAEYLYANLRFKNQQGDSIAFEIKKQPYSISIIAPYRAKFSVHPNTSNILAILNQANAKLTAFDMQLTSKNISDSQIYPINLYACVGVSIIYIIIGLLFYALTERVLESEQLNRFDELIGVVPSVESYREYSWDRPAYSQFTSSFEMIYANLVNKMSDHSKVVLVTSSWPGEGKSTISANLAIIAASFNKRTLLVRADLRRPLQNSQFEFKSSIGLSDYLKGDKSLTDIVMPVGANKKLFIITTGRFPENPAQQISSDKMKVALLSLKEQFDLIILDSPPIFVADTIFLSRLSDQLITVMRFNYTRFDILSRTLVKLKRINSNTFLIANCASEWVFSAWGWDYGYEIDYVQSNADVEAAQNVSLRDKLRSIFKRRDG